MKLFECKLGEVVYELEHINALYGIPRPIGHIVGLMKNDYNETIPVVKWADGHQSGIHFNNIDLLSRAPHSF